MADRPLSITTAIAAIAAAKAAAFTPPVVIIRNEIGAVAQAIGGYVPSVKVRTDLFSGVTLTPDILVDEAVPTEVTGDLQQRCNLRIEGAKMTLERVMTQIYNVWGMEVPSARTITFARERVLEIVNASLQILYSRSKDLDYFSRTPGTITFAANVGVKDMPSNLQCLVGHVRIGSTELRAATSREELQNWETLYFGPNSPTTPRIYWLETLQSEASHDSAACRLHILPTPSEETTVSFDYAIEAPYFHMNDFNVGARLRIPHSYVETLLLPICKYKATLDNLFRGDQALRQSIVADYQRAMRQLGMIEPETTAQRNQKPREAATA
jgi:hypothetical protein